MRIIPNERALFSCSALKGPPTGTVRRKELVVFHPQSAWLWQRAGYRRLIATTIRRRVAGVAARAVQQTASDS
jgi:hypothetical protein